MMSDELDLDTCASAECATGRHGDCNGRDAYSGGEVGECECECHDEPRAGFSLSVKRGERPEGSMPRSTESLIALGLFVAGCIGSAAFDHGFMAVPLGAGFVAYLFLR